MNKFFGCSKFSAELKNRITKESGLPISYALASNKLISKVPTNEVKPNGQLEVAFGNEKSYLAPFIFPSLCIPTQAPMGFHKIPHPSGGIL